MTMMTAPGPLGLLGGILAGGGEATRHVVIIIPGSGPTDCDGNNPLGVNSNTYKLLAEGLRAYPNRVLFQTMTPQAKCSIAS